MRDNIVVGVWTSPCLADVGVAQRLPAGTILIGDGTRSVRPRRSPCAAAVAGMGCAAGRVGIVLGAAVRAATEGAEAVANATGRRVINDASEAGEARGEAGQYDGIAACSPQLSDQCTRR